jgi:hypothetical protein
MEEWRIIIDFPNYSISNLGNIINNKTNKFMKPSIKGGYYHICLINGAIKKTLKVHRLVGFAFIENSENKPEINHKNKNKLDNHIDNLEWMTKKENNQHRCIGLIYKSNKNKPVLRLDIITGELLQKFNSIEEAGIWVFENNLTSNSHNGRNSIGNCLNGLSLSSYGFLWSYETAKTLENEEWKKIDVNNIFGLNCELDTDKTYFVSNLGRFKNSFGTIMDNYKVNDNGYIRVYIYNKTFVLHRLIALTFLENLENKEQVNHKDGDKLNNCVSNLEWVTNKENQIHKFKMGLGNNFTRKIKQFDLSGNYIKEYKSIALAAKDVNISKSCIYGVLTEKRKTAAGFIWKYSD